ncbi:MAG: hypothetical protein KDA37_09530 [Planctomycetales bacterium]|nr:hypothetical protein [Planctomycetales bacterium]
MAVARGSDRGALLAAVAERCSAGVLYAEDWDPTRAEFQARPVVAYVVEFNEPVDGLRALVGSPAPAPPVVALTGRVDGLMLEVLRRGAWDVLDTAAPAAAMERCLASAIGEGHRRLTDRRVIADFYRRSGTLTQAERDVLEAVCEGKLNKQIARDLSVSVRTIEQRRRRLFNKMDVTSAVPLATKVAVVRTLERLARPQTGSGPSGV